MAVQAFWWRESHIPHRGQAAVLGRLWGIKCILGKVSGEISLVIFFWKPKREKYYLGGRVATRASTTRGSSKGGNSTLNLEWKKVKRNQKQCLFEVNWCSYLMIRFPFPEDSPCLGIPSPLTIFISSGLITFGSRTLAWWKFFQSLPPLLSQYEPAGSSHLELK